MNAIRKVRKQRGAIGRRENGIHITQDEAGRIIQIRNEKMCGLRRRRCWRYQDGSSQIGMGQ
jgi:hypothetical protein